MATRSDPATADLARAAVPGARAAERPNGWRICFVAHNALGALTRRPSAHAGGIERQQAMMARWLAARGFRVSMITWGELEPPVPSSDGVDIHTLCRRDEGLPGLRFVHPRWTSLNRALTQADADLYYYNCGDLALGQIALWARRRGRRLIYSVASDADCERALPNLRSARERIMYRYGLARCDAIITQTHTQHCLLKENFGRDSTTLPMPSEGAGRAARTAPGSTGERILWIGRISPEKRPDWLLDIAERLPHLTFEIVGAANTESDYSRSVLRRAGGIPNVILSGRVPYEGMAECYARASILCSTSVYEGFPNIFLEAWSLGIPVVTTCDPDGLVAGRGLGSVGRSVSELAECIEMLSNSQELRAKQGKIARDYFRERHAVDTAMEGFVRFFDAAARTVPR